jgi:hypothetical protein
MEAIQLRDSILVGQKNIATIFIAATTHLPSLLTFCTTVLLL